MTFSKLAKEVIVEVLQEKSITQKEVFDVTQEEEDNWMIPIREFLQLGKLPNDPQKAWFEVPQIDSLKAHSLSSVKNSEYSKPSHQSTTPSKRTGRSNKQGNCQRNGMQLMLLVYKLLLLVLKVNAASTKVTTAQRLRLLIEFLLSEKG
ncbi:hypothetical protein Tco_1488821 [Tanacetum coccineum]